MIIRPDKTKVEDYFNSPAINQSRLKLLPKGVDYFNSVREESEAEVMFYEEKTHFILGHAAEMKLQNGIQDFEDAYHMSDIPKPSDKLMSITQQFFDIQSRIKEPNEPFPLLTDDRIKSDIANCIDFHQYYPKWTMDVKVNKVRTECTDYYNDLILAFGKQILDLDEATTIEAIVNSLQRSNRTSRFFNEEETPDIDYYYQLPIYFTYLGVECKILIDILEVNHISKSLKVIDIKTLGDFTLRFPSSMRKFRYDFQVAFYTIGVNRWKNTLTEIADYKIQNPEFIVETTKLGFQGNPLVFTCSDQLIDIALYGRKLLSTSEHYDDRNMLVSQPIQTSELFGVIETVELYKWHLENGFEVDKLVRENQSKLLLDWEGIVK